MACDREEGGMGGGGKLGGGPGAVTERTLSK